jgi:hypothetical protein
LLLAGSLAAARFDDGQVFISILFDILSGVTLTLDTTQVSSIQLYCIVSFIVLLLRLSNKPGVGLCHALLDFWTRFGLALGRFVGNDSHRF